MPHPNRTTGPDLQDDQLVVGLDEVGLGCLAGPLVVAAVLWRRDERFPGLADSKTIPEKRRLGIAEEVLRRSRYVRYGWVSNARIDVIGVAAAWQEAATTALAELPNGHFLLVDGTRPVTGFRHQETIVKGDAKEPAIMAASVVAKVARDFSMMDLDPHYPAYRWCRNKGYGTSQHLDALKRLGVTPHHRRTFVPALE